MMRFAVLGSGSAGNAILVEAYESNNPLQKTRVLIDAGLSAKQLSLRMNSLGVDPQDLNAILLTHEHSDHTKGLRVFLKQHQTAVYSTLLTREVVQEKMENQVNGTWHVFESLQSFRVGAFEISNFPVPHDAVDPSGFFLKSGESTMGVATDLGYRTLAVLNGLKGAKSLFLEANYEESLLEKDTKRPWSVKQRISSRHGHLSNQQVLSLIKELREEGLESVVLGHLSSDCNCPKLVKELVEKETQIPCWISSQDQPTPWVWCGREPAEQDCLLPGF